MGSYLGLKPQFSFKDIQIKITDKYILQKENIFDYGIQDFAINGFLTIEINKNELKYLPFIILREVFRCYIPLTYRNNDSINIIINHILMVFLSKHNSLDEWRTLIRASLEAKGRSKDITDFDRLENFFYYQKSVGTPNPINFFFTYINTQINLPSNYEQSFTYIIFKIFENKVSKSLIENDLAETIRIITFIFYQTKYYRNLLQYKNYFQNFKKNGLIITDLSLRKFTEKMDWIKLNSYISPHITLTGMQ